MQLVDPGHREHGLRGTRIAGVDQVTHVHVASGHDAVERRDDLAKAELLAQTLERGFGLPVGCSFLVEFLLRDGILGAQARPAVKGLLGELVVGFGFVDLFDDFR